MPPEVIPRWWAWIRWLASDHLTTTTIEEEETTTMMICLHLRHRRLYHHTACSFPWITIGDRPHLIPGNNARNWFVELLCTRWWNWCASVRRAFEVSGDANLNEMPVLVVKELIWGDAYRSIPQSHVMVNVRIVSTDLNVFILPFTLTPLPCYCTRTSALIRALNRFLLSQLS